MMLVLIFMKFLHTQERRSEYVVRPMMTIQMNISSLHFSLFNIRHFI